MFSVVTGAQFGDEGKGKVVDFLSDNADAVVRFQGGDNAGHTVEVDGESLKLKLIPSGVLEEKRLFLGPGTVVNPNVLADEMEKLRERGIDVSPELLGVDAKASVIMPFHRELDALKEEQREESIGTTKRGIGYAYQDKVARDEVRIEDLVGGNGLDGKIDAIREAKRQRMAEMGGEPDDEMQLDEVVDHGERLAPYVTDVSREIHEMLDAGRNVLVEGAQGTFLDVIHGTQKYVTSSSTITGAACSYLGVGPGAVDSSIGVLKAYITRVGKGPLPTELDGETGDRLRQKGGEFGTNTGRPRRCGWLDLPLARKAVNLNGYDWLALTKLDVLSGFDEVKICAGYRLDGDRLDYPPETTSELARCEPVFETLPGWDEEITGAETMEDLPENARNYVERVEEDLGTEVRIVSVGPGRRQTIRRRDLWR